MRYKKIVEYQSGNIPGITNNKDYES